MFPSWSSTSARWLRRSPSNFPKQCSGQSLLLPTAYQALHPDIWVDGGASCEQRGRVVRRSQWRKIQRNTESGSQTMGWIDANPDWSHHTQAMTFPSTDWLLPDWTWDLACAKFKSNKLATVEWEKRLSASILLVCFVQNAFQCHQIGKLRQGNWYSRFPCLSFMQRQVFSGKEQ